MIGNRPAEAGEQLPEVIGEPVLPDRTERLTEADIAMLSSLADLQAAIFNTEELKLLSALSEAIGGADGGRDT